VEHVQRLADRLMIAEFAMPVLPVADQALTAVLQKSVGLHKRIILLTVEIHGEFQRLKLLLKKVTATNMYAQPKVKLF